MENELTLKTKEIFDLHATLMHLQTKYDNAHSEMLTKTLSYENTIQQLSKIIQELKLDKKNQKSQLENERKILEVEIRRKCSEIINHKEMEHQNDIEKLKQSIEQQELQVNKTLLTLTYICYVFYC